MRILVSLVKNEIEAAIIKGSLENSGIKSTTGPAGNLNTNPQYGGGSNPNVQYGVFVEEKDVAEAKKILDEMNNTNVE